MRKRWLLGVIVLTGLLGLGRESRGQERAVHESATPLPPWAPDSAEAPAEILLAL